MLDCAYQTNYSPSALIFLKRSFPAMAKKSLCARFIIVPTLFVVCCLMIAPVRAQDGDDTYGVELYRKFRVAKSLPCGQRTEAILAGRELISRYEKDELNKDVVKYVKAQLAVIIPEEIKCSPEFDLAK